MHVKNKSAEKHEYESDIAIYLADVMRYLANAIDSSMSCDDRETDRNIVEAIGVLEDIRRYAKVED